MSGRPRSGGSKARDLSSKRHADAVSLRGHEPFELAAQFFPFKADAKQQR